MRARHYAAWRPRPKRRSLAPSPALSNAVVFARTSSTAANARVTAGRPLIVATHAITFGYSASAGLPRNVPTPRAQGKVAMSARVALTAKERHDAEPLFEGGQHPADLRAVAVECVVVALRCKAHEVHVLPEHRADQGHLHHHPLDRVEARDGVLGQKLPGLFREVEQDRPRFEERVGLAARSVMVGDDRHLGVRVELQKLGLELLFAKDVDRMDGIGEPHLLEGDIDLDDVRASHGV